MQFDLALTYDCKNLFPPSNFSCSERTLSTLSQISKRLACNAFAWLSDIVSKVS